MDGGSRSIASRDDLAAALRDPEARLWVDVTAPSHIQVNDVADLLTLHPLIAEDIAEKNQRAKVEEIEGSIHVAMFSITYPFRLPQLRGDPGAALRRGPDFLLYALTDGIVDGYLSTINNHLSVIMKRLTGVTVILAGIGAVAGVFGMSEAGIAFAGGEATGFWAVTGFVALGAAVTALVLRRINWIWSTTRVRPRRAITPPLSRAPTRS